MNELNDLVVPHVLFNDAVGLMLTNLTMATPGDVVLLVGPTRSGKSETMKAVSRVLIGRESGGGLLPVVTTNATNCSTSGTFSTKAFTLNALVDAQHPIYACPASVDAEGTHALRFVERTPEGVLRSALEQTLKHRRSRYLVVDEAHHVQYARGGRRGAAAILDSWKCMAASGNFVLVLIGPYSLMDIVRLSPHLVGRKHQVILRAYSPGREGDVAAFNQILDTYSTILTLPKGIHSLRGWGPFLLENSLGCIGLLRAHLRQALIRADVQKSATLTYEHLSRARPTEADLECLRIEMEQGRSSLRRRRIRVGEEGAPPRRSPAQKSVAARTPFQTTQRRYRKGGRLHSQSADIVRRPSKNQLPSVVCVERREESLP